MLKKLLLSAYFLCCFAIADAQWIELGTGAYALPVYEIITAICADTSGNIYATGEFSQVYKWNGSLWEQLGSGFNNYVFTITAGDSNNIYAGGLFTDGNSKQYIAKWSAKSGSWIELGTGSNGLNANDNIFCIYADGSDNIYVAGKFTNTSSQQYVAKWDGTTWTQLGSGFNNWISSICSDNLGNIYVGGQFTDVNSKTYIAQWSGSNWIELGAQSNLITQGITSICSDSNGNIYAAGRDANSKANIAQWNGSNWNQLGNGNSALNANGYISSICSDTSGNIYAAGNFTDANAKQYVAKWNGSSWSGLGNLNANNYINSICLDTSGYVYAAGTFQDNEGRDYVAKYQQNTATTGVLYNTNNTQLTIYPNPTNSIINLTAPEAGQATVYNLLGEAVVTQNVVKGNNLISFEKASNGVYTLVLTAQNGNYAPVKIIKD